MTKTATDTQTYVYTTYIRTTPEKLWEALTHADFTEKYWFGTRLEGDWKKGGTLRFRATRTMANGVKKEYKDCEVLAYDPPKHLAYTFPLACDGKETTPRNGPSRVTIDLTPMGDTVKLSLVHENLISEDVNADTTTWRGVNNGWPGVLSSLKTLLETGKEITYPAKAG